VVRVIKMVMVVMVNKVVKMIMVVDVVLFGCGIHDHCHGCLNCPLLLRLGNTTTITTITTITTSPEVRRRDGHLRLLHDGETMLDVVFPN